MCRGLLLLLALIATPTWADEPAYDLLLRGGTIVDGTGNPAFLGDVAVRNGRIAAIARQLNGPAIRTVDCRGLIIAPGFIDMHSHSDFLLLEDGSAPSKIRQGVTTEILGESTSAGPASPELRSSASSGAAGRWFPTLGDYFRAIEKSGIAVNVGSYVGISNVWQGVMGTTFDRPTPKQMQKMQAIVEAAMIDGALGLSTSLMMPPGSLTTEADLVALCEPVRRHGGIYATHIRSEGEDVLAAVREAIAIGERARVPVDILHIKIADQKLWGRMNEIITLIEGARKRGVNVQANIYPYTRGHNNLSNIVPPWAHEGGNKKFLARLKDPALRPRLKKEIANGLPGWYNHYTAVGRDWSRMLVSGQGTYAGLTMDRVLATRTCGQSPPPDPLDAFLDLLIEQNGSVPTLFAHHTEADMTLALRQPWCSIGSDGSAFAIAGSLRRGHPHPRNFGTFPRILGVYVREQSILTWEEAIRKMTSANATKAGLLDRGLLRPGLAADITVFDPKIVRDTSTFEKPFQYPVGIRFVAVNGVLVLDAGEPTPARPGRTLRLIGAK
ncbi:MAG: D-aminoacylase [Bacteroidales bacterium]|nr:D-aminoacylase [Bacteroidales bacterium]